MIKGKSSATLLLYLASIFTLSLARPIFELPHESASSLKINTTQVANAKKCSYTVKITTSCSSPRYTRDHISLSFGDAYGTQVYVPRLDDPSSGTFERCSTDTFQISGPCSYQICYLYLYRSGYDGWKPKSATVYGYNSKAVTFYYDTFIPNDVWWGFNHCRRDSAASA